MAKILVLYYSSYGHVETMANAVADGARSVPGSDVAVKRAPETAPEHVAREAHFKLDQPAPVATVDELPDYDAIIVGTPTRYGRMTSQMASFLDQTGGLWFQNKLVGKVGAVFTSTASQHGGQETTIVSTIVNLMHLGMTIVGLPYTEKRMLQLETVSGGTPYGASTIAAGDGSRQVSADEIEIAKSQGRHVAEVTAALVRGRAG